MIITMNNGEKFKFVQTFGDDEANELIEDILYPDKEKLLVGADFSTYNKDESDFNKSHRFIWLNYKNISSIETGDD